MWLGAECDLGRAATPETPMVEAYGDGLLSVKVRRRAAVSQGTATGSQVLAGPALPLPLTLPLPLPLPCLYPYRYPYPLPQQAVKFFLDGALGSWGAAMLEPYVQPHGCPSESH